MVVAKERLTGYGGKTKTNLLLVGNLLASLCNGFSQPIIILQPESQTVGVGANVTLSVSAIGFEPLSYLWRRNETALAGETNDTLTLANVQPAQAGSYTVVITDESKEATTSEAAMLTVNTTFIRVITGPIATDEAHSFGCAWGDYDGDGYVDLIVGNGLGDANALYHNNGDGTFTRVITGAIATTIGDADGVVWGDYDNDGHLDLFVANFQTPSFLFRNDGKGNFTRITSGAIVENVADSVGCSWGDYDNDGFLDLVVVQEAAQNPQLYRNDGTGTFTQIFDGPIPNSGGGDAAPLWADYDDDGMLDLFIFAGVNNLNRLYHNDGGGSFSLVPARPTGFNRGGAGDWGDYDNDGDLDLVVAQVGGEAGANEQQYRNNSDGTFTRILDGPIPNSGGSSPHCAWGDYDNDGWIDLLVSNTYGPPNFLFHNNGDGTFTRITEGDVVNVNGDSLGCAWGDYDNDGFLDLFITRGGVEARETSLLYHNDGNSNRWLSVKCVGAASNRSGLGAKVRVKAVIDGVTRWQLRDISSGTGYAASRPRAHFGLGEATNVDIVRIEWPSGAVRELRDVAVNQILTVTEPARLQMVGRQIGGSFLFQLTGVVGFRYALEMSSNLTAWTPWTNVTTESRTTLITDPAATTAGSRFYRAAMQ